MHHHRVYKKEAVSTVFTSAISIILSIIASSHHWLHMMILLLLGGSTNMMIGMSEIFWIRRVMVIATLIMSIYTLYRLIKHKNMPMWMKVMNSLSILISLGFIFYTLSSFGW